MKKTLLNLAKDTGLVYGAQMGGVAISLASSVLIARLLGPDGRGAYAWIMTMHVFAVQLGMMGMDTVNRRLGASRPELVPSLAGISLLQSVLFGGLAGLAIMAFSLVQPIGITHKMGTMLGMLAVPGMVAMTAFTGLALARSKAGLVATTELFQRIMLVILVGVTYGILGYLTLNTLMIVMVVTLWSVGALAAIQVRGFTPLPWRFDGKLWWNERYLLIGALGSGLATFGLQKLDLVMLGWWRPVAESGWYAVAQALMDASLMLPGTLGVMLLSRLAAMKNRAEQRLVLGRILMAVLVGFGLMAAVAAGLAGWIIPLLFGAKFTAAVPVFRVLMVAAVAGSMYYICQNAATGIGRVRYVMAGPLTGMAVKAGMGAALVPTMGMMGAAWSSVAAYACAAAVALAVAWGRR